MKNQDLIKIKTIVTIFVTLFLVKSRASDTTLVVYDSLFDQSQTETLGLEFADGTETYTIFAPSDTTDKYSNGVFMISFKDHLYCMWQSSAIDEDAEDTWIAYSRSQDGITWSKPMVLAATIEDGYCSSGGWWVNGDTLVGYINTWPNSVSPRGGFTRYTSSTDGLAWTEPAPVAMADKDTLDGIFEQDPHALPDGRIVNAAHFQRGLRVCPIYTDDPSGIRGWKKGDFVNLSDSDVSRELEPSWYLREDGAIVMIFRDQNSTYKKLVSVSFDRGESWTQAVVSNMPDSRSKQSAGNFGDTTAFMVSNPVNNKTRIPLAITLSPDGFFFNTAYLLRAGGDSIQPQRYEGQYKRAGYHYPKSIVWNDYLYASYATNKEDVQYTRVPVSSFVLDTISKNPLPPITSIILQNRTNVSFKLRTTADRSLDIILNEPAPMRLVRIYNLNGQPIRTRLIQSEFVSIDMSEYPKGLYVVEIISGTSRASELFYLR